VLMECWKDVGTLVGFRDVAEEDGANDTTPAPHQCDSGIIEVPSVILGGGTHEHEPLSIRNDFRSIQCLELISPA
jgi:hypothetical protein